MLVKSGRPPAGSRNRSTRSIASVLCSRLLDEGDYVAYELEDGGFMKWTSRCKPMTDQVTEFVPAWALLCSSKRPSDLGLHDFTCPPAPPTGTDVREDVEKMLIIDYLMANFDRRWNNFGVLIDSESREWLQRGAGVSTPANPSGATASSPKPSTATTPRAAVMRPFARKIDEQLGRYCRNLSWFDRPGAKGFSEEALRHPPRQPVHRQRARQNR